MRPGRVALCALLLVAACSDDGSRPPAGNGGTVSDGGSSGTGSLDGQAAEAGITPRPDLCEGLARGGQQVAELQLAGTAPPPLGGSITPGTYDLSELNLYGAEPPDGGEGGGPRLTGKAGQATLVVTAFSMRFVDARGDANQDPATWPQSTRAILYRVEGTNVVATSVCPATALPVNIPFSAVGNGLALFVDDTHRELYTRRP